MTTISKFSTAANFTRLKDALDKVEYAIREASLAVQAGIPDAATSLATAQDAQKRIQQVLNTYFPTGTAPIAD